MCQSKKQRLVWKRLFPAPPSLSMRYWERAVRVHCPKVCAACWRARRTSVPDARRCDMTITLACPKQGFFFFPGRGYTGELFIGDIGLPPELEQGLQTEMLT